MAGQFLTVDLENSLEESNKAFNYTEYKDGALYLDNFEESIYNYDEAD